jgi:branched-chain amino acid transport system ATP-binding protein
MDTGKKEVLRVRNLKKNFGSLQAVGGVDLVVKENEVRAVIGPNGAGKSTFFNLITGDIRPDEGEVFFKGQPITGWAPHRIARLGVARSFQITHIFPQLTVFENVLVSVVVQQKRELSILRAARGISQLRDETLETLKLVGLGDLAELKGQALSHGDKKRLEFAIVLACKPELLLLDEPTAGMSQEETDLTVGLVKKLSAELGITIVFTEHDMRVVFSIADYITVLQQGLVIAEGLPEVVRKDPRVIEAYIGEKRE